MHVTPHQNAVRYKKKKAKKARRRKAKKSAEADSARLDHLHGPRRKDEEKPIASIGDALTILGYLGLIAAIMISGAKQIIARVAESNDYLFLEFGKDPAAGWIYALTLLIAGTAVVGGACKLIKTHDHQTKLGWVLVTISFSTFLFSVATIAAKSQQALSPGTPDIVVFFRETAPHFLIWTAVVSEVTGVAFIEFLIIRHLRGVRLSIRSLSAEAGKHRKNCRRCDKAVARTDKKVATLIKEEAAIIGFGKFLTKELTNAIQSVRSVIEADAARQKELKRLAEHRLKIVDEQIAALSGDDTDPPNTALITHIRKAS